MFFGKRKWNRALTAALWLVELVLRSSLRPFPMAAAAGFILVKNSIIISFRIYINNLSNVPSKNNFFVQPWPLTHPYNQFILLYRVIIHVNADTPPPRPKNVTIITLHWCYTDAFWTLPKFILRVIQLLKSYKFYRKTVEAPFDTVYSLAWN